jgi:hypothetical protein
MSFLSEGQLMGLAYVISSLAALVWAFRRSVSLRGRDADPVNVDTIES